MRCAAATATPVAELIYSHSSGRERNRERPIPEDSAHDDIPCTPTRTARADEARLAPDAAAVSGAGTRGARGALADGATRVPSGASDEPGALEARVELVPAHDRRALDPARDVQPDERVRAGARGGGLAGAAGPSRGEPPLLLRHVRGLERYRPPHEPAAGALLPGARTLLLPD